MTVGPWHKDSAGDWVRGDSDDQEDLRAIILSGSDGHTWSVYPPRTFHATGRGTAATLDEARYAADAALGLTPATSPAPAARGGHYRQDPSGVECIEVARHWSFNLGSVLKYLWRHGKKPGASAVEDLRKARDFLDDEIARLEAAGDARDGQLDLPFAPRDGHAP